MAPPWSPSPTSPTASASRARCATATTRWKRPTASNPTSSSMSPTNCARRSTPSWALPNIWPRGVPGDAQSAPGRICRRHRGRLQHPQGPDQRHSRSGADRIRRAAAGAGAHRSLCACSSDIAAHAREWAAKMRPDPGAGLRARCRRCSWPIQRRMRQIVFNLLSNAFKFTPRGGAITLSGRDRGRGCADRGRRQWPRPGRRK